MKKNNLNELTKSPKNKTIDFSLQEGKSYLDKCLRISDQNKLLVSQITDKIIVGDIFSTIPKLPCGFVDLLIADPPYNIQKNFHGNSFYQMSFEKYLEYTENWINLIKPLLKPNASLYICCDWKSSSAIEMVLQKHFNVQNRITWQREKGRGAKRNWKNSMEDIWFATCSDDYVFNIDDVKIRRKVIAPYKKDGKPKDWEQTENGNFRNTYPSNFWDDISIPYWSMAENTAHPTQKSEKLLAKLILASSNSGQMIFDPFMGSGTTAVTAKKLNRHFCTTEINEQYCAWAQKRLELAETDKSIQGYTNGVFWERNTTFEQQKQQ